LVNQVQEVYRRQGVDINDRHIELIVRQMSRKVRVIEPGDTDFLIGDRVDRIHFKAVNDALVDQGKRPAVAKQTLQGSPWPLWALRALFQLRRSKRQPVF